MGSKPTTAQKLEVAKRRRGLKNRITNFTKTAVQYLGEDAIDGIYETAQVILDEDVGENEQQDENQTISSVDPEHQILPFPSAVTDDCFRELPPDRWSIIGDLWKTELAIREGHAADALDHVRTAIIHLSWQYKNNVRTATSGAQTTRAWDKVKFLNHTWKLHRRIYNDNRTVMLRLGDGMGLVDKYPVLDLEDCVVSTSVVDRNTAGQSTNRLTWIWATSVHGEGTEAPEGDHANECKLLARIQQKMNSFILKFIA